MIDPFVIYNDHGYAALRDTVSKGMYEKQIEKLEEATKVWLICVGLSILNDYFN